MRGLVVALAAVLGGCAQTTPYRAEGPKNLIVRGEVQKVKGTLDVFRVDSDCSTRYQGTVPLDRDLEISVPAGQRVWLVVHFDSPSLLRISRGPSAGALLTPLPGARYEVAGRFRDNVYWVSLREVDRRGAKRELSRRGLETCKPTVTF